MSVVERNRSDRESSLIINCRASKVQIVGVSNDDSQEPRESSLHRQGINQRRLLLPDGAQKGVRSTLSSSSTNLPRATVGQVLRANHAKVNLSTGLPSKEEQTESIHC